MSGGMSMACLAGANMPLMAVQAALGLPVERPRLRSGLRVRMTESPIVVAHSLSAVDASAAA